MKISSLKERADLLTGKASELNRQLAFAGIAIIWVLKRDDHGTNVLDMFLLWPLTIFSLSIIADLAHYVYGGQMWCNLFLSNEKKIRNSPQIDEDPDPNITVKRKYSLRLEIIYWIKIGLMFIGYVLLVVYMMKAFFTFK